MKAEKDKKTGKWLIQYRYTDWQGKRRKSTKRGFATKREAEEWLRNFLITQKADFDMKFADFWKMYCADMETRLREHTMRTKKYIVELKILPYFGKKRVNDITAGTKAAITPMDWIGMALICFILPAVLSWLIAIPMRKKRWIKENDLKLDL